MDLQGQADQKPGVWDDRAGAGSIRATLYPNDFSRVFSSLLAKTGVTAYQIAKFTNINEGYLSRLRSGEKRDPSFQIIVKVSIALAHLSPQFALSDAERLFKAVGRSLGSRY
jgi:hypothetical protein